MIHQTNTVTVKKFLNTCEIYHLATSVWRYVENSIFVSLIAALHVLADDKVACVTLQFRQHGAGQSSNRMTQSNTEWSIVMFKKAFPEYLKPVPPSAVCQVVPAPWCIWSVHVFHILTHVCKSVHFLSTQSGTHTYTYNGSYFTKERFERCQGFKAGLPQWDLYRWFNLYLWWSSCSCLIRVKLGSQPHPFPSCWPGFLT